MVSNSAEAKGLLTHGKIRNPCSRWWIWNLVFVSHIHTCMHSHVSNASQMALPSWQSTYACSQALTAVLLDDSCACAGDKVDKRMNIKRFAKSTWSTANAVKIQMEW